MFYAFLVAAGNINLAVKIHCTEDARHTEVLIVYAELSFADAFNIESLTWSITVQTGVQDHSYPFQINISH
ncbi:hypothetical protein EUX98_g6859 [Antrodiella citrinella]|uniref:Uncharacterized protein n=1 Tax=Antrodiella citrinella TaxID=2447956 RepID=A0A4S4MN82_9APHY|nr:hypothetical protein EUX98_g6859 [Antrodiella citrinella]